MDRGGQRKAGVSKLEEPPPIGSRHSADYSRPESFRDFAHGF